LDEKQHQQPAGEDEKVRNSATRSSLMAMQFSSNTLIRITT